MIHFNKTTYKDINKTMQHDNTQKQHYNFTKTKQLDINEHCVVCYYVNL